ncbi:MAG: hypothetical protein ACK4UN_06095 [Limisphaerales bacterium]
MKPLGTCVVTFPKTGDFFLAAVQSPFAVIEKEGFAHESKMQPCRHPDAKKYLHAPYSLLELVEFSEPKILKGEGAPRHPFTWLVAHWNVDLQRNKVYLWEASFFPVGTTKDEVLVEWKQLDELWSNCGYFTQKEYAKKQAQRTAQEARRALVRGSVKKEERKEPLTTLASAQLQVLSQSFKHTIEAKLKGDELSAIEYFEAESSLPVSNQDAIDRAIVKAYSRPGGAPYDKEIATEIRATTGIRVSEDVVKKRRSALGLSRNTHGPRPIF